MRAVVTGGTGCIGAVAVRDLLAGGFDEVVVASRGSDASRLRLWLEEPFDARLTFAELDLGDAAAVTALVRERRPSHVIHLAALQSPDCDKDPDLGLRINVGGTQALLEACERLDRSLQRFVFASSAAVYGPRSFYPGPTIAENDPLRPPNRYGTWKTAGEHLCRLFHERSGVPTVCLRLNTTYGPGRDRGMTSAVTTAMRTVAEGEQRGSAIPFRMPYRGRENYHYVEDVGAHFAITASEPFDGFAALNIRGETVAIEEFLARIAAVAAELGLADYVDLGVADDARANLFVSDLDDAAISRHFPTTPRTPLTEGIRKSLSRFARRTDP